MALLLPDAHPERARGIDRSGAERPLRIGILNLMPKLEAYEPYLLAPFAALPELVEPVFVRLETHGYQSSDAAHLERFYVPFAAAHAAPLDGLLLTGAPVEELPFTAVHYWEELVAILAEARRSIGCTLGLCWGGMALAALAGVEKVLFPRKLFGVFEDTPLGPGIGGGAPFVCAHSRHSGLEPRSAEAAAREGRLRLLARGAETGYTVVESPDGRLLGHLGHPEYEAARLVHEWERDRAAGRTDVLPPAHFDLAAPTTTWEAHRRDVFGTFVRRAATSTRRSARHPRTAGSSSGPRP